MDGILRRCHKQRRTEFDAEQVFRGTVHSL